MSVSLGLRAGFGPTEGVLEQLQAILREQEVCVGEQVANVEVAGQDDLGSGQVLTTRFGAGRTTNVVPSNRIASISWAAWLVLGSSKPNASMTPTWPSIAFWLRAERRARRRICLGIRCS